MSTALGRKMPSRRRVTEPATRRAGRRPNTREEFLAATLIKEREPQGYAGFQVLLPPETIKSYIKCTAIPSCCKEGELTKIEKLLESPQSPAESPHPRVQETGAWVSFPCVYFRAPTFSSAPTLLLLLFLLLWHLMFREFLVPLDISIHLALAAQHCNRVLALPFTG